MTRSEWYLALGAALFVLGSVRVLLTTDLVRRVVAVNVAGAGTLIILIALAAPDTGRPDSVLHALALTGIVITVSLSGLALALARHIEANDLIDANTNDTNRNDEQAESDS
ncbi:NADH-quinone oxidoreductase subunit K [Rhodococcus sp. 14-2470-1a]|uniref:NADH-quinone oxidoreductase subunit K n=1 Tax=Rhodococcus sp. 14-2470-1a TaxID=2023150 RepID=UPI000B9A1CB1|nr:NADH-quinone oxidoreductase subunit K [Rhodococcus sp. 14-2470-1a]OZF42002.1 hypothetical protein CH292_26205 [Rhodococcus sp. 14-2470-1a]